MMELQKQNRNSHKDEFVKATNIETNEVKFFKNGMDASRGIGCSHVLAYKVLKNEVAMARGWRLEYISKNDPQCETFKKEIEDRILNLRQSLVDYAHDQMLKRKEFVEEGKARRKAEHDEFVRVARVMASCALQSLKEQIEREAYEYREALRDYHAIVQLTMEGKQVRVWDSAYQAERETNITNIRQVVLGLRKSAGGYRWEFLV